MNFGLNDSALTFNRYLISISNQGICHGATSISIQIQIGSRLVRRVQPSLGALALLAQFRANIQSFYPIQFLISFSFLLVFRLIHILDLAFENARLITSTSSLTDIYSISVALFLINTSKKQGGTIFSASIKEINKLLAQYKRNPGEKVIISSINTEAD